MVKIIDKIIVDAKYFKKKNSIFSVGIIITTIIYEWW